MLAALDIRAGSAVAGPLDTRDGWAGPLDIRAGFAGTLDGRPVGLTSPFSEGVVKRDESAGSAAGSLEVLALSAAVTDEPIRETLPPRGVPRAPGGVEPGGLSESRPPSSAAGAAPPPPPPPPPPPLPIILVNMPTSRWRGVAGVAGAALAAGASAMAAASDRPDVCRKRLRLGIRLLDDELPPLDEPPLVPRCRKELAERLPTLSGTLSREETRCSTAAAAAAAVALERPWLPTLELRRSVVAVCRHEPSGVVHDGTELWRKATDCVARGLAPCVCVCDESPEPSCSDGTELWRKATDGPVAADLRRDR